MRIVVFSDSHGRSVAMEHIVMQHSEADIFLHLGDGEYDMDEVRALFPNRDFRTVRGNCDWGSTSELSGLIICGGWRIFYAHGHAFNVKYGTATIEEHARGINADLAMFGHTHLALKSYSDGLHLFNPGSITNPVRGNPSYGIVDITEAGLVTSIVEV